MTEHKPLARLVLLLGLLLTTAVAAAEDTLYVTDRVLADLHTEPAAGGKLLRRLPTGTSVELVAREGAYVKVRTPDGTVGWMLGGKLQEQRPAQLLLLALTEQQERTVAELKEVRNELLRMRERQAESGLSRMLAALPTWLVSILFGVMALMGFILGVLWLDRRYRHRHGGFRV